MALVVPDVGEILMLQYLVNMLSTDGTAGPSGGQRVLRLYTNNPTVDDSITNSIITEASGATGYAPITLVGSSWTTTMTNGTATAVYSAQFFTFTTAVSIYGYYITSQTGGNLLWVEKFSGAPFQLPTTGGQIAVAPRLSLD
jgi:hypothetical protein